MVSRGEFCDRVLGFISDDFEAPSTITSDIARALTREVGEGEVLDALLVLARDGRAQAYTFATDSEQYVPVSVDDAPFEMLWFMARR